MEAARGRRGTRARAGARLSGACVGIGSLQPARRPHDGRGPASVEQTAGSGLGEAFVARVLAETHSPWRSRPRSVVLLNYVNELVRQKRTARGCPGGEAALSEDDVRCHRVRRRPYCACRLRGAIVCVDPHTVEAVPEASLHGRARDLVERSSRGRKSLADDCRGLAPVPAAAATGGVAAALVRAGGAGGGPWRTRGRLGRGVNGAAHQRFGSVAAGP